jgi:hypothetical protein
MLDTTGRNIGRIMCPGPPLAALPPIPRGLLAAKVPVALQTPKVPSDDHRPGDHSGFLWYRVVRYPFALRIIPGASVVVSVR